MRFRSTEGQWERTKFPLLYWSKLREEKTWYSTKKWRVHLKQTKRSKGTCTKLLMQKTSTTTMKNMPQKSKSGLMKRISLGSMSMNMTMTKTGNKMGIK